MTQDLNIFSRAELLLGEEALHNSVLPVWHSLALAA